MPANPWELRADVGPLEAAALRWEEISALMTRRGDEIVTAARRATEGWDAVAAESYDQHRRQVLLNLDRFTTLATQIAGSLRAISSIITSSQTELDRAWTKVAMIPHEVVGESRYLVFRPSEDDDRGKVTSGEQETGEIRRRMSASLTQESTRLRSARAEFVMVRTELKTLAGGFFPDGIGPGDEVTGVGSIPPSSTSVPGSAQAGISALPPIGAISVSMPDLHGISSGVSGNVSPFVASAASGLLGRRGEKKTSGAAPPMGGMGAGAMGARAGSMSRGMASGRSGPTRLPTPKLEGQAGARGAASGGSADDEATRVAREKEAAREAKRAALEEKRAERAARKAEREHDKDEEKKRYDGVPTEEVTVGSDAADDEGDDLDELDDELGEEPDGGDADSAADGERRTTVETGSGPGAFRR